jgi:hypothetical protein
MKPPDAEATKVLEAMKMEATYVDWVAEKEAIHHNTYRALFEAPWSRSCNSSQSARSYKEQWESSHAGVTYQSKQCGIGEKPCCKIPVGAHTHNQPIARSVR